MTYPQENLSLEISDSVFRTVMDTLRDSSLSAKERVYLGFVTGRAGKVGVIWHQQKVLADDLGLSTFSVCRIEKKLVSKGRLKVFDFGGRTYRSPYPQQVDAFLAFQHKPAPPEDPPPPIVNNGEGGSRPSREKPEPEPICPNCKCHLPNLHTPLAQTASETEVIHRPKPLSEAVEKVPADTPKRTCTKEPVQENPVQRGSYQQEKNQQVTTSPVNNPTDWFQQKKSNQEKPKKNPYRKNRVLVQHLTNDIAEKLNAWGSWNYLCKIVWSISEEGENWLYEALSWVKQEAECGRCNSKIGLFDWKLAEMGIHPLKC